ncbi:MAG: hypothetical protein K9K21_05420 [Desulfotignum sp.]|nr:hypothetical protein [Desulfotignum sp.]
MIGLRSCVSSTVLVVVLGLMLALLPVSGCGKKAPPRVPEKPGQAVAPPGDPAADITGTQLTLTWTHDIDPDNAMLVPRYFEVSMAMPDDCEGCPFVFKPVGQVSMPDMVFEMLLNGTGPWYFRVQAVAEHDTRSDYSKTVRVEIP